MSKRESKKIVNSGLLNTRKFKNKFSEVDKAFDGLSTIQKDKSFQILKLALEELKEKYGIGANEIFSSFEKPVSKEILIPISIFEVEGLSALEAICKYLKEELELNYSKTALLMNRNGRTIWTTYNNACKKIKEKLPTKDSKFLIPASILKDRKFSVLEIIIGYLKENFNLRFSEIAILLNRNQRNIWATYSRYKKKK